VERTAAFFVAASGVACVALATGAMDVLASKIFVGQFLALKRVQPKFSRHAMQVSVALKTQRHCVPFG
jgi:hypothetical protein